MDALSEHYGRNVASAMATVFGPDLVGVYLHGSAVLGGFDARRSDIDILAVCEGPTSAAERSAAVERLSDRHLPCPAHGLELSIVTLPVARHPTAQPAFELHMTTAPEGSKVVDGHGHDGDPDLVLHFAVCRSAGRALGPGPVAAAVFAPVADDLVVAQLVTELRWSVEHASGEYAVLNACRAWRFAVDGALVSKIDGGRWALDRVPGPDRELIRTALDRQRCVLAAELDPDAVRRFIRRALAHLTDTSSC
ncbi:streptomycin 3'-adenylyltransferase [Saccharothrix ecbatanensis]|uniref:Streptomycin 3'-adenylyltransferase n=1 Tax=Saccharothrix ecbatanensis TaxID=1105145 RepID=A0A7W9M009_9PSEU|nr:aminoglycoside adenylyltransferase domain-containing protein [Saccharothrix ecbatanensis]MBB5802391.1 streptomycin 3'-adenylyltransferase [Saccharothrix ecbatanensis]